MVRDRLELAEKLGKPGGKDAKDAKDTKDAKDAKDAKDGGHGASGSGAIPRVTKQTTPPPMSASSPSTSGLPPHGAPLKKP